MYDGAELLGCVALNHMSPATWSFDVDQILQVSLGASRKLPTWLESVMLAYHLKSITETGHAYSGNPEAANLVASDFE